MSHRKEPKTPPPSHDGHSLSRQEKKKKHHVLSRRAASRTESIAEAVVVKDGNVFLLCSRAGEIPLGGVHGLGLYYHDCRFLNGYRVAVSGTPMNSLAVDFSKGSEARFEILSPALTGKEGGSSAPEELGVSLRRHLDGRALRLEDLYEFHNYSPETLQFTLSFEFRAAFEDMFVVRGMTPQKRGTMRGPEWHSGTLRFAYEGTDDYLRQTEISFDPSPHGREKTGARFPITLKPHQCTSVTVRIVLRETRQGGESSAVAARTGGGNGARARHRKLARDWMARFSQVRSDSILLNEVFARSIHDLKVLETSLHNFTFFSAGVPWFVTLFGRDSLITAMQTLAFERTIAEQTLRGLALFQGKEIDAWRDEQPGKILHEIRTGELARTGAIPHTPYYGTVDATPLFLIVMAEHAHWSGDLSLFEELQPAVHAALRWMNEYGGLEDGGYLTYGSAVSEGGLANQGWKDSGDAIVDRKGHLACPPIALVEVQGYAYRAKCLLADLYERAGERETASRLREEAARLRERFNRDFWLEERNFYALALQKDGVPAGVISSNPGQALWTEIIPHSRAGKVVEHLMSEPMFSGWGIRTLSTEEVRYNPLGYHLGTVWPHDNSLIAAGMKRYGYDGEALQVIGGVMTAAMHFSHYRLPELFAGMPRSRYDAPVSYPVACHPQAWAAGSVPYFIQTMLGLVPEAFEHRLRIVRPVLPGFMDRLHLTDLRVGNAVVDLQFERTTGGTAAVQVTRLHGKLEVMVEAGHTHRSSVFRTIDTGDIRSVGGRSRARVK